MFSKITLKAAYHQLELDKERAEICIVNTSKGLFKVNGLSFLIAPSSALWQRTIDEILKDLPGVCDDILISTQNNEEHFKRFKLAFEKNLQHNVHINKKNQYVSSLKMRYLP